MKKKKAKKSSLENMKKRAKPILDKIIENLAQPTAIKEIVDAALIAGIAYVGYQEMGKYGLIIAPLAYKMALAPAGGVIAPSQIAGCTILAGLGLSGMTAPAVKEFKARVENLENMKRTMEKWYEDNPEKIPHIAGIPTFTPEDVWRVLT